MTFPQSIHGCAMATKRLLRVMRRRIFEFFGNPAHTPKTSLGGLDEKLEKYLNFKGGVFIEAGANDGISQSNTYYLEHGRRWQGILVEPIPELYQKCVGNRRRARVFNCALVASGHSGTPVRMHYANLMSVADGAMPDEEMRKHLEFGVECQNLESTYEVEVPGVTLASLIVECGFRKIDFLSLDVEGGEAAVLDGLNLEVNRPRFILVEARYFDAVDTLLTDNGYRLLEQLSHHDFLYTDDRLLESRNDQPR